MGLFGRKNTSDSPDIFTKAKKEAEKARKDVITFGQNMIGLIAGGETDEGGSLEEGRAAYFCAILSGIPNITNKDMVRYVKKNYGFELERCIAVVVAYNLPGDTVLMSRLEGLLDEAAIDNSSPKLMMKLQILVSDALFKKQDPALAIKFENLATSAFQGVFTNVGKINAKQVLLSEYEKEIFCGVKYR